MEFILFFSHPQKKKGNPTHIAHIGKAPQANAETKALPKSAILPSHPILTMKVTFYILNNEM
jgi:hypothetical protein